MELVKRHISDKIPLFVTDELNFYRKALLKHFGVLIEFPRTGKRRRPRKPKIFTFDDLNYAQVVKPRINWILKKVEKNIFGKYIEQSEISTTLLERQNLTFRQEQQSFKKNNRVFKSERIVRVSNEVILHAF